MLSVIVGVLLFFVGLVASVIGFVGAASDPTGASHYGYIAPGVAIAGLGFALVIWR